MPALASSSAPDPNLCPLCGQANRCAMEAQKASSQPQLPCWCTQVDFGAELLARVPEQARRLACICERCARQASGQPTFS